MGSFDRLFLHFALPCRSLHLFLLASSLERSQLAMEASTAGDDMTGKGRRMGRNGTTGGLLEEGHQRRRSWFIVEAWSGAARRGVGGGAAEEVDDVVGGVVGGERDGGRAVDALAVVC